MQAFVGNLIQRKARALSPEFKHALAREVLKTERLRIIALIITATVLAVALTTTDVVAPAILDRIWRGHFPVLYVLAGYVGFVLFEALVLALVSRQLKRDHDVPRVRRYVGAFIETSLPSLVLVVHMNNMGAVSALGFVGPLLYFVFIILSTLRLDFWLSTFTGFVAAAELLGLALLHPAARATVGDPMLTAAFLSAAPVGSSGCGRLPSGSTKTACRRTATSQRAGPLWRHQHGDHGRAWNQFMQQAQTLRLHLGGEEGHPCDVATGPVKTGD